MLFTENATHRRRGSACAIPSCPRCFSIEVDAVQPLPNASFRNAAEAAWQDHWTGRRASAARLLLRWICVAAANRLRAPFTCIHCGLNFWRADQ